MRVPLAHSACACRLLRKQARRPHFTPTLFCRLGRCGRSVLSCCLTRRSWRRVSVRSLLLRMQNFGLQPDEQSFAAVIQAGAGTPGSSQLAEALRPQLEAAVRRRGVQHAVCNLSPRSTQAVVSASSTDRARGDDTSGSGLRSLQQLLAQGAQLDARAFVMALSGCAKQSGRSEEALQIMGMLEAWVKQDPMRARQQELAQAYSAAIAACDESNDKEAALELLPRMKTLGVAATVEVYHAAITACRHEGGDVPTARALLAQMKREKLAPMTMSYNCLLHVLSAAGGRGDEALSLLGQLQRQGLAPDDVTYLHLLTACRPTPAQTKSLRQLAWSKRRLAAASSPDPTTMSGAGLRSSHTGELEAAVSLPFGGTARASPLITHTNRSAASSLGGDDEFRNGSNGISGSVSGMWSDNAPPWRRALALLPEMRRRGVSPTERTYAAAIELCARTSEVAEAFRLLHSMPAAGLRPDGYSIVSAATAAAVFGEYPVVLQLLHEVEVEAARRHVFAHGRDALMNGARVPSAPVLRSELRLGLFDGGRGDGTGEPLNQNARTRLHHAALLACAAGKAPLPQTLALIALMPERGLMHKPHAINFGLSACVTHGAWREAEHVLRIAREAGVRVRPEEYAKALHAYGAARPPPPWSATAMLLNEVAERGVVLPQRALLHALRAGVAAGVGWDAVRHVTTLEFEGGARITSDGQLDAMSTHGGTPLTAEGSRERAAPSLEALVQGELLCLAAQDGTEHGRLPVLIWRVRKSNQKPTSRLLHRTLAACGQSHKEGWRNVPALLDLARIERVQLSERAFVSAVEAHAPPDVYWQASYNERLRGVDCAARLRELASLIGLDHLTPQTLHRVEALCNTNSAARAQVQRLLTALRPRSAIHEVMPAVQQASTVMRGAGAVSKRKGANAIAAHAHSSSVPAVPNADITTSDGSSLDVNSKEPPGSSKKPCSLAAAKLCELIALLAKRTHEEQTRRTLSRRPGSPQTAQ